MEWFSKVQDPQRSSTQLFPNLFVVTLTHDPAKHKENKRRLWNQNILAFKAVLSFQGK